MVIYIFELCRGEAEAGATAPAVVEVGAKTDIPIPIGKIEKSVKKQTQEVVKVVEEMLQVLIRGVPRASRPANMIQ